MPTNQPPEEIGSPAVSACLPNLLVQRCDDFEVTGLGDAPAWQRAVWEVMTLRIPSAVSYETRFKLLYSANGLYVLFDGRDRILTATQREDFGDLWTEDVFECFFWTDPTRPIYFEYEISPLGHELPILVPNIDGRFLGWRPWHYTGARCTRRRVSVQGGPQTPLATIEGWRAEVFIPYELFSPLAQVPPRPGMRWRANFYRMDYDAGQVSSWHWAAVGESFHEYDKFGTLQFA